MSMNDYKSATDEVLFEEIYRRAKLANRTYTVVINPQEMLGDDDFKKLTDGVLINIKDTVSTFSDLSKPDVSSRIREHLLQKFQRYINTLNYVITYSFTYQDNTIFIILYTHSINKLSQVLKDWPSIESNIEGYNIKLIPKSYDIEPDFGSGEKRPKFSKADYDIIWPALQEAQKLLFSLHSNIVGIIGDYFKENDDWRPCLRIFIHSKGYIPIGEKLIPKKIKDVPIKVIEGRYLNY